jgi:hypothetical protein
MRMKEERRWVIENEKMFTIYKLDAMTVVQTSILPFYVYNFLVVFYFVYL